MGKYKIHSEDIWHQPLSTPEDMAEYSQLLGECDDYQEAVTVCKKYLDDTLANIFRDEKTEKEFRNYWFHWGEALYISPAPGEPFSSRDYVEEKINKHYKK